MANPQMNSTQHLKRVKALKDTIAGSSILNPKRMCLPPSNITGNNISAEDGSTNQTIRKINSNLLAKLLQAQCGASSIILDSTSSPSSDGFVATIEPSDDQNVETYENYEALSEDCDIGDLQNEGLVDLGANDQEDQEGERETIPHNAAVCCNDCREERERFEILVLRKLNEVLQVVRGMDPSVRGNEQRGNYPLLPSMPFHDIGALEEFDRDLQENEQMRDQFISKIQEIGGKSVQKAVKFSMEVVMSDELTRRVVWILGADNIPKISKFRFPYLIIDVVQNAFQGTKRKAVEDRIADWLRRGGDRLKAAKTAATNRRVRQLQE